jgi:RIO-like serine/threonine protein kinase
MRHTRKVKRTLLSRKPKSSLNLKSLRTKISRIHPFSMVKKNPYPSLGVALGISAISGLAVWLFNKK